MKEISDAIEILTQAIDTLDKPYTRTRLDMNEVAVSAERARAQIKTAIALLADSIRLSQYTAGAVELIAKELLPGTPEKRANG